MSPNESVSISDGLLPSAVDWPSYVATEFVDQFTPGKVVYLSSADGAAYWRAESVSGEVCLITTVDEQSSYASSCTSPKIFNENGVGVAAGVAENSADAYAYLLPSATESIKDASRPVATGPQGLLILTARVDMTGATRVGTADGRSFDLPDLVLRGDRG